MGHGGLPIGEGRGVTGAAPVAVGGPDRSGPSPAPVLFVIGTRPEAIKMLPVILAFQERPGMRPVVVSTGQHPELVREVLAAGGLTPDVEFGVPLAGRSLNELTAHVTTAMEAYVRETYGIDPSVAGYPVATFVHGDTTTAAAAALASFHMRIPVAHVEAGLRTHDTGSPFPEELNRQLIGRIATIHFAPTTRNLENLIREGVAASQVYVTGNTAIDALLWARSLHVPYDQPALASLEDDDETRVVTITAHRRESWGEGLRGIATAVRRLALRYPDTRFVLPVHPNPVVRDTLLGELAGQANVLLAEPMGYAAFARLLARSTVAITDSGGIQEEAPALGVPVVVTREVTERQEGVVAGTLELVGTDPDRIVAAVRRLLDDPAEHARRSRLPNPYGDGRAARRIALASETFAFGTPVAYADPRAVPA